MNLSYNFKLAQKRKVNYRHNEHLEEYDFH